MNVYAIFQRIKKLTHEEGQQEYLSVLINSQDTTKSYHDLKTFLTKLFKEIDDLSTEIIKDSNLLISVKDQKLLRTCFQLIISIGIAPCLLPGLGISLSKRCLHAATLPKLILNDDQKYDILVDCTDFITRNYKIPILKNIIITLHLVDYLAVLIQLSFAPIKRPGSYSNYIMTQEKYDALIKNQQKYRHEYEHLVTNCFQPTLMKELLVLQSVTDPAPPVFVKRLIAKEMSRRLTASGGLLSLIRCFIESYNIDVGFEWRKIDMISKIVAVKHGSDTEDSYLQNICSQIMQILSLQNTHYLATAIACTVCLNDKFGKSDYVKLLVREIFQAFDPHFLVSKTPLPGTVILSPQEVQQKINVLHAGITTTKLDFPSSLLLPNLRVLFSLGVNCVKNAELKVKITDIILKCLEQIAENEMRKLLEQLIFGKDYESKIVIEEYDAGLAIKYATSNVTYQIEDSLLYFVNIFKASTDNQFVQSVFENSLQMLIDFSIKRHKKSKNKLYSVADDPVLLDVIDEQYIYILQLLSEISVTPKIVSALKTNPFIVLPFIEHFIIENQDKSNEECTTIALVLLNTILASSDKTKELENRFSVLIPILKAKSEDESNHDSILCKEAFYLLTNNESYQSNTEFGKAVSDLFDNLMPVRAHGIIALTKLIDAKDPETISKKHYVFCLFQEYLKDPDSYMYLSAVNGIASLGTHCTDDVLSVLCKEFLEVSNEENIETRDNTNKVAELRMKIGDIIVKVTKRLGEMAIVHKALLLNTMLCGCRDYDPFIRTSALSNLAEICLVLHYKMGSIIYEVLHCVWSVLETDKAIECRRAAVMVISSLIKGLGHEVLLELKDNLLPIYRTLKELYRNNEEDSVLRLHAQLALEELNDIVNKVLFPEVKLEKQIFVMDKPPDVFK